MKRLAFGMAFTIVCSPAVVAGRSLTVFADLQTGINVDGEAGGSAFTQRYFLAGVRRAAGTLTFGRHSTPYKMAGLRLDPFYDTSVLSAGGGVPSTPELTLAAAVGHVEEGAVQSVTGTGFHAGAFYTLYPQARLHALYSRLDPDPGPDHGNLALGLTCHFALERR